MSPETHYSNKGSHKARHDWHKELPIVQKRFEVIPSKGEIFDRTFMMRRIKKSGK